MIQPETLMDHEVSRADSMPETSPEGLSPQEFRRVFDQHHGVVYNFFLSRGFGREDALDLTQETFLRVYKSMGRLRGAENLLLWLRRITANVWKNELRRLSAEKRDGKEVPIDDKAHSGNPDLEGHSQAIDVQVGDAAPLPLDEVLDKEEVALVRQALRDLPPQMKRCFLLRIEQDMKYKEIAAAMQLEINTVKSQIHQARQRLKAKLEHHYVERSP